MTDTSTTPEEITPEQAEAELAALEQSVIDGADVDVADLVAARERFTLAGLIRKRNEKRDAAQAQKAADAARETAKAEVSELMTTSSASVEEAAAAASMALDLFVATVAAHNIRVQQAAVIFQRANLAQPDQSLVNPLDAEGLDHAFYTDSWGEAGLVVENGHRHSRLRVGPTYQKLVHDVAHKHRLQTAGNSDLAYKIGRD